MKKVLNGNFKAGAKRMNEPRLLGDILQEMYMGWNVNTDLGVDLKSLLHSDRSMRIGKEYRGVLRLDHEADIDEFRCQDAHYTFVETLPQSAGKRNPHVFRGKFITVTRRDDGTLRLNFRPMPVGVKVDNYAFKVYLELRKALIGLVEK